MTSSNRNVFPDPAQLPKMVIIGLDDISDLGIHGEVDIKNGTQSWTASAGTTAMSPREMASWPYLVRWCEDRTHRNSILPLFNCSKFVSARLLSSPKACNKFLFYVTKVSLGLNRLPSLLVYVKSTTFNVWTNTESLQLTMRSTHMPRNWFHWFPSGVLQSQDCGVPSTLVRLF